MSLLKVKKDGTWISVVSDYAARALVAAHNLAGDAHAGLFNSKVNTVENSLTTTNKNVVGAINELDSSDDTINARIDNIGRYLALWNGPAGLPTTSPATLSYTYKAGDHYKISTITGYAHTVVISPWAGSNYTATVYSSDSTPFTDTTTYAEWLRNRGYSAQNPLTATGTIYGCPAKDYYTYYASADRSWKFYLEYIENGRTYGVYRDPSDLTITDTVSAATICYRPNGSTYTGIASTTVETSPDVAVGDIYFYDGTAWSLQINHGANAYNKTEADTLFATKTELSAKSAVSVSSTGTATDEVQYITVDGVEKKLKGAGAWGEIGGTLSNQTDLQSELTRLDGRCDNLQNLGRYLALWNCVTGLPTTNPTTLPYTYKAGDYYRINTIKPSTYKHTIRVSYGSSYVNLTIDNDSQTQFNTSTLHSWLYSGGYTYPGNRSFYSSTGYKAGSGPGDTETGTVNGLAYNSSVSNQYYIRYVNSSSQTKYVTWSKSSVTVSDTVTTYSHYKPNGSTYNNVASTTVETQDVAIGDVYFYDGTSWSLQVNHSADTYTKTQADALFATKATTYTKTEVDTALAGKASTSDIPTKTSDLTNDSGFLTEHQSLSAYRTSAAQDIIDADKVGFTDYASASTGGVIKQSSAKAFYIGSAGAPYAGTFAYSDYQSADGGLFIGKNTFEAVLTGKNINNITAAIKDAWTAASTWVTTNGANVLSHLSNSVVHITSAERTTWNSKVTANPDITGSTKCKVTYDAKGLITAGANLVASDIPSTDATKITSGTFADARIASAATWNAKANIPVIVSISLPAASWSGSASPYSQTISVAGSKANSKIDLQPDATVLGQMIDDGCMAICVVNNNNVLTAYAVGDKPTVNLTVQATMYEVVV